MWRNAHFIGPAGQRQHSGTPAWAWINQGNGSAVLKGSSAEKMMGRQRECTAGRSDRRKSSGGSSSSSIGRYTWDACYGRLLAV
jgi:hypothetical protein